MALQVNLTLSKTYFLPGEVVQVSVQICNDADRASAEGQQGTSSPQIIHIKELSFQACGSERTDPAFIHRLYRPEVPVEAVDSRSAGGGSPYVIRRLHAEHHELSGDAALSSFTFSLPATATPSFRTPMVQLRWVLRFELTVGPRISFASVDKRARAPRPQLEQLVWSLPLVVRPPLALPR
ncbi:hypothetical protein TSOC_011724 [Tetrabaena socialis]|uniref:RAB6A-GEF complex partner protein 2 n=1 Tax=Tetrabaena socialis TaxID=47790 RepID=A0A2J7ZPX1_9CHLO|nr:hypothetical protein TSOC_011724 [Tetrabaena socialis]|eukprot:PNH02309.1 hypothetical protein TSOC_011724 [Tetrabaena socialis]